MNKDRARLRSEYAAALVAQFGDRASAIVQAQVEAATGNALAEWTAIALLLETRANSDLESCSSDES